MVMYITSVQGDVIALIDSAGTTVVKYTYDAWGKPLEKSGTLATTLGTLNPFRYRGYVYDEETGLYYLRSRYYNPVWGRFVNADTLIGDGGLLSHSLFTYCANSPVALVDHDGFVWVMGVYAPYYAYYHDIVKRAVVVLNAGSEAEYSISGGRIDILSNNAIYEVKPDTPLHIDADLRQVERYQTISGFKVGCVPLHIPLPWIEPVLPNYFVKITVRQQGPLILYGLQRVSAEKKPGSKPVYAHDRAKQSQQESEAPAHARQPAPAYEDFGRAAMVGGWALAATWATLSVRGGGIAMYVELGY